MIAQAEVLVQRIYESKVPLQPKNTSDNAFINELNISKRNLTKIDIAKIASYSFAGTLLLTGGLSEDSMISIIGGVSLFLAIVSSVLAEYS